MTVAVVELPDHIAPMLARSSAPFDSAEHLFEIKWDGVRAISYVDHRGLRMHGRRRRDLAGRYPELGFLAAQTPGLVLDGELVAIDDQGRPDFAAMLARENQRRTRAQPDDRRLVYVVFDLLYERGRPLLDAPLADRRERLAALIAGIASPRLALSEGVVGEGCAWFEAATSRGLEGIVAKRLDAPYRPGTRTDAWLKIKPERSLHCLVLGYESTAAGDFKSLIIASDVDGRLRCVGKVGAGIGAADRRRLRELLSARPAAAPLVDTGMLGSWVEPGIYCTVGFLERTARGHLRAPVFRGLA